MPTATLRIELCGRLADAAGQELRLELAEEPISIAALRDAGVRGVLLGEVLFTGAIDLQAAIRAAA